MADTSKYASMPKVELHCHLEGAVRWSTLLEETKKQGFPLSDNPRDELLITGPVGTLANFLNKMDLHHRILSSLSVLERISEEAVVDKYAEGVKLLELRYAPSYIHKGHEHPFPDSLQAIKRGIKKGVEKCGGDIHVGLICIAVAAFGAEEFEKTVDFAIENKEDFLGFDIAGVEVGLRDFKPFMDRLYAAGLKLTAHAAEDAETGLPENALVAVDDLHCSRIGHGIQIIKRPDIMEKIRDKGVHLEFNPTSNWYTGSVESLDKHPIRDFWQFGVSVGISTDDPGVMGISLLDEYENMETHQGLTEPDFLLMNCHALAHAFMPLAVRQQVYAQHFRGPLQKCATDSHRRDALRVLQTMGVLKGGACRQKGHAEDGTAVRKLSLTEDEAYLMSSEDPVACQV
uniref:adenosine deaminase n=1 Tax=Chromera velia CCMP2878 TaxID=1169474 RepID=A0A0G4I336_9ALVE|mmetsp:Transcript_4946/g.9887  ORF Transcript_4946/g.9887 Transcript_4946/m.9887 type:complete len:401 (+) Transcript_4946:151-1353(+)|eukprot:Cvel_10502.t1-p1 / transcript=Cvel_10502.t1 / gene=Cvel_10502 / organism=Chromera_velia_CCMP2878 / gene_product=Adenosine deaminase, putative / transcript_product=Adenosine deaminase, putative / location=Cvel_scaffold635:8791-10173(-) / protein_length=400 / sequence_SO=supercontig / SO=protein_coding / is_pseudo=false